MRRVRLAAAWLALIGAAALHAQKPAVALKDGRAATRIGFARLGERSLEQNQKTLADTIPLRLSEAFSGIGTRSLSEEERDAYRSASLSARITEIGIKLDDGLRAYDLKILTEKSGMETITARKGLITGIEATRKDLEAHSSLDPRSVDAEGEKPIEWAKPSGAQRLYPDPASNPRALCAAQDLDILVYGTMVGSNGYAFLEMRAYHRFLDKTIFEWKTALAEDDSQSAIAEFSRGLATALLGRETTSLLVDTLPLKSEVRVDGVFVGNGPYLSPYQKPGRHEIEVSSPGYASAIRSIDIEEGRDLSLSFSLAELSLGEVSLMSLPEGGSVYIDSAKIGATPMELPVRVEARSGRVKAEGREDEVFVIKGGSAEPIAVKLVTKEEAERNSFAKQRDRFYLSAGAFMLSLPVSVLCVGMFAQYYDNLSAISMGNFTEEQRLAASQEMEGPFYSWQTAAYASGGLSAGLLGFCVYRFALYLKASR